MGQYSLPSSAEVRSIIEGMSESDPIKIQVGNWAIPINGKRAKMGFMYQYLVAGRIAEAFGEYAPLGRYAIEVRLDGVEAVLFAVKTAKRKTKRGWTLRPALIPLDQLYEPWAREVMDYMKASPNRNPFALHTNPETSLRYASALAEETFYGLKWRFVNYRRKIGEVKVEVPDRWKNFTSHELRKRRVQDLELYYKFDSLDLCYYGGWEPKDRGGAMKHYLELDLDENPENVRILTQMAQRYFNKLLIPITSLLNPEESNIGGIEIIGF